MRTLLFMAAALLSTVSCMLQAPDYLKSVSAEQLQGILQQRDIFLIDVHTPEQRHIPGTDAFIPYDAIEAHQSQLPTDKSTPIFLYCRSGRMANDAARTLYRLGYHDLTNLQGGTEAWLEAKLPLQAAP